MIIKRYKLLKADGEIALDNLVNEYLEDEWQLYGQPIVTEDERCYQAMVRFDTA